MSNVSHDEQPSAACPTFHGAVELIGRRWNGVIISAMLRGDDRFSDLRTAAHGITDTMLAQRLRELEDAGIVTRTVGDGRPVQVRYRLTAAGEALSPVLASIAAWSIEWTDRGTTG